MASLQIRCLEEALHESNQEGRIKVAEMEAMLAESRREHSAVLEAQKQLQDSEGRYRELAVEQEEARALAAELQASLAGMQAENSRLLKVFTKSLFWLAWVGVCRGWARQNSKASMSPGTEAQQGENVCYNILGLSFSSSLPVYL